MPFDPARLRAEIAASGMTAAHVARLAGMRPNQMTFYLGGREPTFGVAERLARALGIPMESFSSSIRLGSTVR